MAKVTQVFEDKVRRADAMAFDPLLTNSALVERLSEKFNHGFSYQYIRGLSHT
jgi:hypothetical protein